MPKSSEAPFQWRELAATIGLALLCAGLWTVTALICGAPL